MREYSDAEVKQIVEDEGLGYAVMYYMGSDRIETPKLKQLWDEASLAMHRLEEYLDTIEDTEEEDTEEEEF
jgi:hypothetical protein